MDFPLFLKPQFKGVWGVSVRLINLEVIIFPLILNLSETESQFYKLFYPDGQMIQGGQSFKYFFTFMFLPSLKFWPGIFLELFDNVKKFFCFGFTVYLVFRCLQQKS